MTLDDIRRRCRISGVALLAVFAIFATGCSEVEDPLVTTIGTTRVLTVDPDLSPQSISEPDEPIQAAEWNIRSAQLSYAGLDEPLELTIDFNCRIVDTVYELPITVGRCLQGMVIDSAETSEERPVAYALLAFTMTVYRAVPIDLPPGSDYDADGLANATDNCPLVYNPDQRDDDLNDIGDACQTELSGFGPLLDSDADGVADALDNCLWIPNPNQENTTGLAAEGINDGIGDACEEQRVRVNGGELIEIDTPAPVGLLQPQFGVTSVTADFNDEAALDCNWDAGTCVLDADAVNYCVNYSLNEANLFGCD